MGRRTTPVELGARTVDAPGSPTAPRPPGDRSRGVKPVEAAPPATPPAPRIKRRVEAGKSDSLEPILRDLLAHAARRAPVDARDAESDGLCDEFGSRVLFDVEVDGARYQLLRSATPVPPPPVAPPSADEAAHHTVLSPREREIVRMVALGHPNKTIAAVLEISCWTVGTYLRRIFAKLNVGSRAAMVARVMEKQDLSKPPATSTAPLTPISLRDDLHALRARTPVEAFPVAPRVR
jgi:DNA-binding CsgD family transcriptional regulator